MRTALAALLAGALAVAGCRESPRYVPQSPPVRAASPRQPAPFLPQILRPKRLGESYPLERIILSTLKDAHFEELPLTPVTVPADLAESLQNHYTYAVKIGDKDGFERTILAELDKRGIAEKDIPALSPRRLIELSYTIVCDRLTYHLVDNDKEFKTAEGNFLPTDEYFRRGKGDCDKYRDLTIAAFNILKQRNPAASNIYLGDEDIGGEFIFHAWPTAILLFPDKVEIAHFDPTFHDNGSSLEAAAGFHYKPERFHARVFEGIQDYARAAACFTTALDKTAEKTERASLYKERIYCQYQDKDCEGVLKTRSAFESERLTPHHDSILYYTAEALRNAGRTDESWKVKQELVERYPDSYWIRCLRP